MNMRTLDVVCFFKTYQFSIYVGYCRLNVYYNLKCSVKNIRFKIKIKKCRHNTTRRFSTVDNLSTDFGYSLFKAGTMQISTAIKGTIDFYQS